MRGDKVADYLTLCQYYSYDPDTVEARRDCASAWDAWDAEPVKAPESAHSAGRGSMVWFSPTAAYSLMVSAIRRLDGLPL